MELGLFVPLGENMDEEFRQLKENGFTSCQLRVFDDYLKTDEIAAKVNAAKEKYGVTISALWCGWEGPNIWNFTEGPATLGIVPVAYRWGRMQNLMRGIDFAVKIGVTDIITHMGFIPENPRTTEYAEVVEAIRFLAQYCKDRGCYLLFETGQETPITLRRTIELVGTGNLGINLDTANLILYGKANPVDALIVFGKYVRNTHMKDGFYPTDIYGLGLQVPIGQGQVDFPAVIAKLKEIGYSGPLTIEHEIDVADDQRMQEILDSKKYLESLL